jgi:3-deoxy-D-manno-octulosonic-acid transferase
MIELIYRAVGRTVEVLPWLHEPSAPPAECDVLVHAASAGEVKAAIALRDAAGGTRWIISTGTRAGELAGADRRTPRDVPRATGRLLDQARPRLLVLVEAELWPTLLAEAERRSIPVAVVSARVSPRAFVGWRRVPKSLRSRLLGRVAFWGAASDADACRLRALGIAPGRIETTGLLKWPGSAPHLERRERTAEVDGFFPDRSGPLFVLGSVHPGEVAGAARLLRGTKLDPARARWLAVPRHTGVAGRFAKEIRACGAALDDRFGVLRSWYGVADACLVGGGLAGRGVHDLLEPIAVDRRPLFFAERGDPAGLGDRLEAMGAAVRMIGAEVDPTLALSRAPGAYSQALADLDGRAGTLHELEVRGLLP